MTRQYHLPLPVRQAMGAADFLTTPSNRDAALWALAQGPETWPGHALIIHGPACCGKTHLLSAFLERMGGRALQPSAQDVEDVLRQPEANSAVGIDDADHWAGSAESEEWLQHLYNATKAARVPFFLTARTPPAQWGLRLADISSRLCATNAAAIGAPDDDLVRGLFMKLFNDRQLLIDQGVIEYLARRSDRTHAALCRIVETLDEKALDQNRKISVALAAQILDAAQTQSPA